MATGVLARKASGYKGKRVGSAERRKSTLREMRLRRALSASELAKRAGVATSTVTDIEDKNAKPRMSTIRRLATALDCAPQDIAWPGDPFGLLGDNAV